ncbi:MAG: hypothetical protein AAFZ65_06165 [Planctomycetota bacterium]
MKRALALACLAATLVGCLRVGYRREAAYEQPTPEALATLGMESIESPAAIAGTFGLTEALAVLGAPILILPLGDEGSEGAALGWAWSYRKRWNLNASAPLTDNASGSFEFESGRADFDALVLFFDNDWRVQKGQFGKFDTLLPGQAQTYF